VTGRLCSKPEHCCSDMQSVITPTIKDTEQGSSHAAWRSAEVTPPGCITGRELRLKRLLLNCREFLVVPE